MRMTNICNMVEGLDITVCRIKGRFDDLESEGYKPVGDIVLNFVTTDD